MLIDAAQQVMKRLCADTWFASAEVLDPELPSQPNVSSSHAAGCDQGPTEPECLT